MTGRGLALRCVIVDDSAVFRSAARGLLGRQGVAVVGAAATVAEAKRVVGEQDPDVVLVDVDLGPESGLTFVRDLADDLQKRCILISTRDEADYGDLISGTPAAGFLSKSRLSAEAIKQLLSEADAE